MNTADKIGLLPGFGWMAGHSFELTLIICLLITPIGHLVVGLVGESRLIPLTSDKQFLSFFPGDLYLGIMAAGLLVSAQSLPHGQHWYNQGWWHATVLGVALVIASVMTYLEWKSGVYPTRAIFSPSKIYHNFVLYGGYGYVIAASLIALIFEASDWWWLSALLPGLVWVWLVIKDNSLSSTVAAQKAKHAHIADWTPVWQLP